MIFTIRNWQYFIAATCTFTMLAACGNPPAGEADSNQPDTTIYTDLNFALQNPSRVLNLDLSGQDLKELPESLQQMSNLQYLNLDDNFIRTIPREILEMPRLHELILTDNPMTPQYVDSIERSFPGLTILYYPRMQSCSDYMDCIRGSEHFLEFVVQPDRNINTQLDSVSGMTCILSVDFGLVDLDSLPSSIGDFLDLWQLSLPGKQLDSLPTTTGQLKQLHQLILNNNQLTGIPDWIGELHALRYLDLHNNFIDSLKPSLFTLTNLNILMLDNNRIDSIPVEIGNLTNLQGLFLTHNELTSLPDEIGRLKNLKELYLQGNNFNEAEKQRIKQLLPDTYISF